MKQSPVREKWGSILVRQKDVPLPFSDPVKPQMLNLSTKNDQNSWNGPLTTRGRARLTRLASAKKEELHFAQQQTTATKARILEIEKSTSSIERTIDRTRHAVDVLENSHRSLEVIANNVANLDTISSAVEATVDEHPTPDICQAVALVIGSTNCAADLGKQRLKWIATENQLIDHIVELELELREWRSELAFLRGHLAHLETYFNSVSNVIHEVKKLLSPMRIVPPEIWTKIFDYWINDRDLAITHLPVPSPLLFGHVCKKWRKIVFGTPKLWKRCDLYAFTWWPQSILNMFMLSKEAARGKNTIRYHFPSENLPAWSNQARRSSQIGRAISGSRRELVRVPVDEMRQMASVRLEITTQLSLDDHALLPLGDFHAVTVGGNSTGKGEELVSFLRKLGSVADLELENVWLTSTTSISMPHLKRLAFQLGQFTPFDISTMLHANLQELKIRHQSVNTVTVGSSFIPPLPHLHHLAVTPHEHSLISRLMTPKLKHLTLYPANGPVIGEAVDDEFQSLRGDRSKLPPTVIDHLIKALVSKLHTVEEVTFEQWRSQVTDMLPVYVLERILGVSSSFQHFHFDGCHLDGPALISSLAKANSEKVDTEELLASERLYPRDVEVSSLAASERLKSLHELTLSSCTGVTCDECDILASTVGKLNLYI